MIKKTFPERFCSLQEDVLQDIFLADGTSDRNFETLFRNEKSLARHWPSLMAFIIGVDMYTFFVHNIEID